MKKYLIVLAIITNTCSLASENPNTFTMIATSHNPQTNIALKHISNYIGEHAYSSDYNFQENLRKNDLFIAQLAKKSFNKKDAEQFFVNGWGQVLGALIALKNVNCSNDLNETIKINLEKAMAKEHSARKNFNPSFSTNVREFTKNIMMYPHQGKFYDFQQVNIKDPIDHLNSYIQKDCQLRFALHEGKLYLNIDLNNHENDTIFQKLWKTNLNELLQQNGYHNMEINKEYPHLTLINSNVIAQIKESFTQRYTSSGEQYFTEFMTSLIEKFNNDIDKQNIQFTELNSTYSEDYSPFEEVIVARLQAPYIASVIKDLSQKVKEAVGINIPIKESSLFHLTIATKYRQPNTLHYETLESLLTDIGLNNI